MIAGLDDGSEGTVPAVQAQKALKTLLKTLKKNRGIHLLIYCVRGTRDITVLQRNYKLLHSNVKEKVPIVLVVTGLEDREPDMESWWRNNTTSILNLGMNFAGHACITALTIDPADADKLRRRREQSYNTICNLIEQHCPQSIGTPRVTTVRPARFVFSSQIVLLYMLLNYELGRLKLSYSLGRRVQAKAPSSTFWPEKI
jgi:hypothetical protein